MLIKMLIIIFSCLIIYQIIIAIYGNNIIEGLETYQEYDTNDPNNVLILAQKNAGNIEVLKSQIDKYTGLDSEVQDISLNVVNLTKQVNDLAQQASTASTDLVGTEPLEIV
jgi:hypothetical protein